MTTRIGVDTPAELVVLGSGTFAIEAGQSGTVSVYGFYSTTGLALQLTYDNGTKVNFSGSVDSPTKITATLVYPTGSLDTTLVKQ